MAATQHALWLLALPVVTVIFCWYFWAGPPSPRRVLWSLVALIAPLGFPPHMCGKGRPIAQGLLGGACLAAVLICAGNPRARLCLAITLGLATLGLMVHHDGLVHRDDLIGIEGEIRFADRHSQVRLEDAKREILDLAQEPEVRLSGGWLSEQRALMDRLKGREQALVRHHREVGEPLWHSRFSRLFRLRRIPCELWSPGGTPGEVADRLEWRDR